jgi:hypothetical protein
VDSNPNAGEGYRRLIPTMPKCEGDRYRGERCREGGMPIPRKGGCRYEERRDTDAEGCNTERPGMKISRRSDANAESERCQCRVRAMPMPSQSDANAESERCRCRARPMLMPRATR